MDREAALGSLDLQPREEGVRLRLRVKPKARADALTGVYGGAVKLSVRAAPEAGKANEAVRRLLAQLLNLPPAAVEIVAGAASQDKTVLLRGDEEARVREAVGRALGADRRE